MDGELRVNCASRIAAALLCVASPAVSADWNAIVVGQSAPDAPKAFADAFHASEALRSQGFTSVQMLRDASTATLNAAIDALQDRHRAVLYYSGPTSGDDFRLKDGTQNFTDIVTRMAETGVTELAILLEDCADPTSDTVRASMPAMPEGVQVFMAASAGPGVACAAVPERMTDMLRTFSGASLQESLQSAWTQSSLATPITSRTAEAAPQPATTPIISVVSNNVVALSPVSAPVQAAPALSPVSAAPAVSSTPSSGTVLIFEAPPQSQIAAIPVALGLPEPSIIVGLIEPTEASFDTVTDPGDVISNEVSYDNLQARRNLRDTSPDLFDTLVSSGAFDPPEALLATALQTELSRMGCYTASIDGIWGRGSRSSVERYFGEIPGVSAVSLEPDVPLFRQIIRQDDIVCRVPQPQAAPARTSTRQPAATTTRRTTTQAPAPRRTTSTPAPRRQTTTTNSGRTIQSGRSLGGVFR